MFIGRSVASITLHKLSRTRQVMKRVVCASCQPATLAMVGLLSVFFMFSPVFSKQARADENNLNTALLLADGFKGGQKRNCQPSTDH